MFRVCLDSFRRIEISTLAVVQAGTCKFIGTRSIWMLNKSVEKRFFSCRRVSIPVAGQVVLLPSVKVNKLMHHGEKEREKTKTPFWDCKCVHTLNKPNDLCHSVVVWRLTASQE